MGDVLMTRLRLLKSKDKMRILEFVNTLTYKIEIKTISYCPIDKKWTLWFVPDEAIEVTDSLMLDLD